MSAKPIEIKILPDEVTIRVKRGESVRELLKKAGIKLQYPCGGEGRCGKCRLKFIEGGPAATDLEKTLLTETEVGEGWRLACTVKVNGDATIVIPQESRLPTEGILITTMGKSVEIEPEVIRILAKLRPQSIERQASDLDLLVKFLKGKRVKASSFALSALEGLAEKMRESDYELTALLSGNEIISIEGGDSVKEIVGAAIDIGTTTVAGELFDLSTGREMARAATLNPQAVYGADVISRIHYAGGGDANLLDLRDCIVGCVNSLINQMCEGVGIRSEQVVHLVTAGNTVMTHLLLGLTPKYIGISPYVSVLRQGYKLKGRDIGIRIHPEGYMRIAPGIGGFVGGDVVADALVAEVFRDDRLIMLIDIGTNGEVLVGNGKSRLATSAAAGPAFEGAQIEKGMRADRGAIDRVLIDNKINVSTIGNAMAVGICGSGLVDAVSELYRVGVIDSSGRIVEPTRIRDERMRDLFSKRMELGKEGLRIVLSESEGEEGSKVYISQKDVRELQLAKGAIATAIEILLKDLGAEVRDIEKVYIAGAFGNYIRRDSAQRIGLIPVIEAGRIELLGDGALEGAKLMLLNRKYIEIADEISEGTKFVELANRAEFQEVFSKNISFPTID